MQQEIGNDGIVLMLFRELTVDQAFPNESRQYSAYRLYTPCCRRPRPLPAATRYVAASAPSGADRWKQTDDRDAAIATIMRR